jgi:hypothetical protein
MKELFSQIDQLVPTLGDWCSVKKASTLASIVIALRPSASVEIGVFSGASFLPIALAHKTIGHGIAYAIDPWDKDASIEGMDEKNSAWWASVDHEKIYQEFIGRMNSLGLQRNTFVYRDRSDNVEPPMNVGLLHVDGNHEIQAVKDVERYARNVVLGGLMVMDDIHWDSGMPAKAVEVAKALGFVELYSLFGQGERNQSDDFCVMQRKEMRPV